MRRAIAGVGARAADVEVLAGRIGADDEKIRARLEAAVSGSCRKNRHVAGANRNLAAPGSAKQEPRRPCGKAKRFMRRRVIVMIGSSLRGRGKKGGPPSMAPSGPRRDRWGAVPSRREENKQ
jgi:hypothetical protein